MRWRGQSVRRRARDNARSLVTESLTSITGCLTQDDDLVDVHVQLTAVGGSSVTLDERIVTAGGRVAATARTVMVHIDESRTAAAPWPDAARAALESARDQ